jgi:hypothetical protein
MQLYSFNKQTPQPLPERIRLSNGLTRTDSTTFTEEEIADAGYVLAPPRPEVGIYQILEWNETGWVVTNLTQQQIDSMIDDLWKVIREKRNLLLKESDWIVVKAMEDGKTIDQQVKEYRQALRDITLQTDPHNIQWPIHPMVPPAAGPVAGA